MNPATDTLAPEQYLDELSSTIMSAIPRLLPSMSEFAERLSRLSDTNGVILLAGNGGAAALLTHFASEVMSPSTCHGQQAIRCIDLTGNSPLFSASTNDHGAREGLAAVVRTVASREDALLALSTSGSSMNLVHAARTARGLGIPVFSLVGRDDSQLEAASDLTWVVGSSVTEVAQDVCSVALHLLSKLLRAGDK